MRTLYYNGRVWTMDSACPHAEAFVVEGDRFVGAGSRHDLEGLLGPGDRRVNLGGRTVVPGLIDAHVHFSWFSFGLVDVNLDGVATIDEVVARVRARAQGLPPGTWISGSGYNANVMDRRPNRHDLDRAALEHPVVLSNKDFHSIWVNSLALKLASVTSGTPDPFGGQIERDEYGEPTGILRELAADLVGRVQPGRTLSDYVEAIRMGLRHANAVGVTGVHDMDPVDCFRAVQTLHARDELTVRFYKQIPENAFPAALEAGIRTGFGNEWVRQGCLKLFADGSLGSQTAHMLEDWEGRPGYLGCPVHTPDELREFVATAVRNDIAVAIHAIGDAANRTVLNAFEHAAEISKAKGLRNRVEHVQVIKPEDISRFKELDVIASVQPSHAPSGRYLADRFWGARSRNAYAFRSLARAGARLAFGSDVPVEPLDPLAGIHAAVWRKRMTEPDSAPWYPDERLTVAEALHGFTLGAAYASGEEQLKGSITPGKLADFVLLTHDIASGEEQALRTVRPQATVVGGKVVFGDV